MLLNKVAHCSLILEPESLTPADCAIVRFTYPISKFKISRLGYVKGESLKYISEIIIVVSDNHPTYLVSN